MGGSQSLHIITLDFFCWYLPASSQLRGYRAQGPVFLPGCRSIWPLRRKRRWWSWTSIPSIYLRWPSNRLRRLKRLGKCFCNATNPLKLQEKHCMMPSLMHHPHWPHSSLCLGQLHLWGCKKVYIRSSTASQSHKMLRISFLGFGFWPCVLRGLKGVVYIQDAVSSTSSFRQVS